MNFIEFLKKIKELNYIQYFSNVRHQAEFIVELDNETVKLCSFVDINGKLELSEIFPLPGTFEYYVDDIANDVFNGNVDCMKINRGGQNNG